MESDLFVTWCQSENGRRGLAVDRDGYLWRGTPVEETLAGKVLVKEILSEKILPEKVPADEVRQNEEAIEKRVPEVVWNWECFDFNKEYQGYYPSCRFTAVAWTKSGFLAAGLTEGLPVLYSSLAGGVWQLENLTAMTPEGPLSPTQPIYAICPDMVSGQTLLLGGKGQVITLTGCPKCVKISYFTDQDILRGELTKGMLKMTLADGSIREVHQEAALQLALSREAAEEKRNQGGIWVYVGTGEEQPEGAEGFHDFTGVLICPLPKVGALLQACPKEQILVFCCESGVKAEAAAKTARAEGFEQAYYLEGRG